jgi:hypothetical protein
MRKRFRWTRKTYRRACSLSRLFAGRLDLPIDPPELLQRLWDLDRRHPQHDDPLAGGNWQRMHYIRRKHDDSGIPG